MKNGNESTLNGTLDAIPLEIPGPVIGPGDGSGIPDGVFTPGLDTPVRTGSGRVLRCLTTPTEVCIFDDPKGTGLPTDDAPYHFLAYIDTKHDNALQLNIRNADRDNPEKKHPDIFPKILVRRAIEYFEQNTLGGRPITVLEGNWGEEWDADPTTSDNWSQYNAYLQKLGPGPYTKDQQVAAAAQTWTGDFAKDLGFTHINPDEISVRNEGKHVIVLFRKPEISGVTG